MINKTSANTFRVRIFSGGTQIGSRTFKLKRDAEAWEREQKSRQQSGDWHDERRGKIKLESVVAEFIEERRGLISDHAWHTDEANLRLHLPAEMKRRPIGSIRTEELTTVLNKLMKVRAQATVRRIRDSFVSLWGYAEDHRYVARNIAMKAKIARGTGEDKAEEKIRPLDSIELRALLTAAKERSSEYASVLEFISLTGIRWGEARELRVKDVVQMPSPRIKVSRSKSDGYKVGGTKSRKPRRVPLIDRAEEIALGQSIGKRPNDLLFSAPEGGQVSGPNLKRSLRWKELTTHRLYDLRHTAATQWLADGVPVNVVSVWLGHSDPSITLKKYAGYTEEGATDGLEIIRVAARRRAASETATDSSPADSAGTDPAKSTTENETTH